MAYKTFSPDITLSGQKINPLSDIMNLGIQTTGNVVFVKHPSDADYRTVKEALGNENLFDSVQSAIDSPKVRSGKNDYVIVCPRDNSTAWVPAGGTVADIQLNKHNVHLVSLGYGKSTEQPVTFQLSGTAGTIGSMGVLYITGSNCEVAGFNFLGTAGTASVGTLGQGNDGGMVTVGAGVTGLDLHDFKIEKQGIQYDAGTTGITGTPRGDINIGSAARDITIRNGYIIGTGLKAGASAAVNLQFNNTNIRVQNVEVLSTKDAAASRFIWNSPGTANGALSLIVDRCKFYNVLGTACTGAVAGTMGVGMRAIINETSAVGCTNISAVGSTFVTPVFSAGTVSNIGVVNPYLATLGTAVVAS